MNLFFLYLTKKCHIQTQARQDKAWQGMARQGQVRPDEARRGKTRRRPDKKVSPGFEKYCSTLEWMAFVSDVCIYLSS